MGTIPAILTSTIVRDEIGIQCKDDWFLNSFLCACCDLYEEMAEWWPLTTKREHDATIEELTTDKIYWQRIVASTDCEPLPRGPRGKSPWVELRQFCRTETSLEHVGDDETEHIPPVVPTDDSLKDFWRPRAIDAVSIHIEGKSACVITVPVAVHKLLGKWWTRKPNLNGTITS